MKRVPIVPTILVGLAIAAMIALGIWQLQRKAEKEALLARYSTNAQAPVMALPKAPDSQDLFRRVRIFCLEVTGWNVAGAGASGFRHIADCRLGAEGPLIAVDVGSAKDPGIKPRWRGGEVTGALTYAPDGSSALWRWIEGNHLKPKMMIVSEQAAPGLKPSPRPSLDSIPNNHLAYAVQWFLFALVALVIYVLALRRRWASGTDDARRRL